MGFSRQEYWSGLPFSPPGNLPDPGIEPGSPTLQADSLLSEPSGKSMIILTFPVIKDQQQSPDITIFIIICPKKDDYFQKYM